MKFARKIFAGALLVLSTSGAFAAESADIRVTGELTPGACTIGFANSGTVDYGKINKSALNQKSPTRLERKTIGYEITCDAPTRVALRGSNFTPDTQWGSTFSLGNKNGVETGAFSIALHSNPNVDGATSTFIRSTDADQDNWLEFPPDTGLSFKAQKFSFGSRNLGPLAFENATGEFAIYPIINPTDDLDFSSTIQMDGLATMTLEYM